jgi:ubiquinone/menaquinone biosynthesis C-methylase UbiE
VAVPGTDWANDPAVASGFDDYDDLPERTIGYPAVFSRLGLGRPDVGVVLDYGCGPGKVALRMVETYGIRVIGVDISEHMLGIARRRRSDPRIRYELIDDARINNLSDSSVDAAISCYVFINIAERRRLLEIATEVHRVLRPGGHYVLLDTNPNTTGIRFTTFMSGEPGRSYRVGERRKVFLALPTGAELELADYHWPESVYRDVLTAAGFSEIRTSEPVLADAERLGREIPAALTGGPEATSPPFLVVEGAKI